MASLSPPASPRADEWDPAVDDDQVFADLPPLSRQPGEGISLHDLLLAEQEFGDPLAEGEEEASTGAGDQRPSAAGMLPQGAGRRLPAPTGPAGPTAAAPGLLPAPIDIDDAGILAKLCHIAAAPPPFAFPTGITFDVTFPDLVHYNASWGGFFPATDRRYWSFLRTHHCEQQEVMDRLFAVCVAGDRFSLHFAEDSNTTLDAKLVDLRTLVHEFFALYELELSVRLHQPRPLKLWLANKTIFVGDFMLAVVDGEQAYCGARPNVGYGYDQRELHRLRDRFEAVIERAVHWHKNVNSGSRLTGTLINSSFNAVRLNGLKLAITQPFQQGGGTGKTYSFQAGHTRYAMPVYDIESANLVEDTLALLPKIHIPETPARTDLIASSKAFRRLNALTRGLIQQYVALRALLATCLHNPVANPFNDLPKIVQLDQSHSNPRSIMILKSAWLVVVMAEKLWKVLLKHERKGEVHGAWVHGEKPQLRRVLESMTRLGVYTQVDAAREALRYKELEGEQKYW